MNEIPVLVTLDVHPVLGIGNYILTALEEMGRTGIRGTLFITASVLERHKDIATRALDEGHAIGSHGLLHNNKSRDGYPPERYDLMGEADQRRFLEEATSRTEAALGRRVTTFRGPCFGISGTTIRILEDHGYEADFSVNSQRLDFLSSSPFSCNHLLAPRLPYHPSIQNAFRAGESALLEVPLSSFIVPFAVMTLMTFRLTLSKLLFRMLHEESKRTGKPIVYMVHPEEFSPEASTYAVPLSTLSWRDLLPRSGLGIRARRGLRMGDPAKIHRANKALLHYIGSFDDVRFMTSDEYVESWLGRPHESR